MKNTIILSLIFFCALHSSCVTRIDVPEEEQPVLLLNLEMLRNAPEITASLSSTNNLKGTYPIEFPEDAVIRVYREGFGEVVSNFVYNEERNLYIYSTSVGEDLLLPNNRLVVEASVPDQDLPRVSSRARVPLFSELVDLELLEESTSIEDDEEFWRGTIRFNFRDLNTKTEQYYQLLLQERQTLRTIDSDTTYSYESELSDFSIERVNSGSEAVTQFVHKDGLFVDLDKLESDYIEVVLQSRIPITENNQVTDHIFSSVTSLTGDHFMHHQGLSNIEAARNDIFGEPALYRSNIDGGLGLFSACVKRDKVLYVR